MLDQSNQTNANMHKNDTRIDFKILLSSTNHTLITYERDEIMKGVAAFVWNLPEHAEEEDVSTGGNKTPRYLPTRYQIEKVEGNRNLTLRRSPHGNKKHRDSFVPTGWMVSIHITLRRVSLKDVMFLKAIINATGRHTMKSFDMVCNHWPKNIKPLRDDEHDGD
jgi:ribosomal protein S10